MPFFECMKLLFMGALVSISACGSHSPAATPKDWNQPAAQQTTTPPFAAPGERIRYRVSAYNVEVAQLQLAVGDVADFAGHQAVVLQANAQSTGLAAKLKPVTLELTAWLDVLTGQPLLFRALETAGKDDPTLEQVEVRFSEAVGNKLPVVVSHPDQPGVPEKRAEQTTNGQAQEMLGVLLRMRAWDGKVGETQTYEAVRSSYIWRVQAVLVERVTMSTELGELPAVKFDATTRRLNRDGSLDPSTELRKFSVWVSDDADRVPLLFVAETDYGDVKIEIADYTAGTSPNLARP